MYRRERARGGSEGRRGKKGLPASMSRCTAPSPAQPPRKKMKHGKDDSTLEASCERSTKPTFNDHLIHTRTRGMEVVGVEKKNRKNDHSFHSLPYGIYSNSSSGCYTTTELCLLEASTKLLTTCLPHFFSIIGPIRSAIARTKGSSFSLGV